MGKQEILAMLKQQQDYLSGEVISQQLGVSRAAVNKAINGLRQDGYHIESATRKGYRLVTSPDLVTEGEIRPYLHTEQLGHQLICFQEVDSTNNYLKRESHNLPSARWRWPTARPAAAVVWDGHFTPPRTRGST